MEQSIEADMERLQIMSGNRQKRTSLAKKAKWVLFDKEELRDMISDIDALLQDLESLFSASGETREDLASREAAALQNEELREMIRNLVEESEARDKTLLKALYGRTCAAGTQQGGGINIGGNNENHGLQTGRDTNFSSSVTFGAGGRR